MAQFEDFDNEFEFGEFEELNFSVSEIHETKLAIEDRLPDEDLAGSTYYLIDNDIADTMEHKYNISKELNSGKPYIRCAYYYKNIYKNSMKELSYHPTHVNVLFEQYGERAFEILGY
jgi:hypothetical protein